MVLKLAVALSALMFTATAEPSFFVGVHNTITHTDLPHPYPIDVCVNVEIIFLGQSADDFLYSKFTCNTAGTEVTATKYGTDSNCSAENANSTTRTYSNTSLNAGQLWSFSCTGNADYVSYYNFREPSCCDLTPGMALPTWAATDICYEYTNDTYSKFACDSDGGFSRTTYWDSDCSTTKLSANRWSFNRTCSLWDTILGIEVYRTLDFCDVGEETVSSNNRSHCDNATWMHTTMDDASAAFTVYPWTGLGGLGVLVLSGLLPWQ